MSVASSAERLMLDLINDERAAVGLAPVTLERDLNESAEVHSAWMLDSDVFSHTGAGGSQAGERMEDAGFDFDGRWGWGENIAWRSERGAPGIEDDVLALHEALMNSPSHRANILSPNYEHVGIGIEVGEFDGFEAVMVTQNFALTDADTWPDLGGESAAEPAAEAPPAQEPPAEEPPAVEPLPDLVADGGDAVDPPAQPDASTPDPEPEPDTEPQAEPEAEAPVAADPDPAPAPEPGLEDEPAPEAEPVPVEVVEDGDPGPRGKPFVEIDLVADIIRIVEERVAEILERTAEARGSDWDAFEGFDFDFDPPGLRDFGARFGCDRDESGPVMEAWFDRDGKLDDLASLPFWDHDTPLA